MKRNQIAGALFCVLVTVTMADDPQAQQDATIVETLLRLENFDLESSAKGKAAAARFLKREPGSHQFFELIEKFELTSARDDLVALAVQQSGETAGVRAVQLLFKFNLGDALMKEVEGDDAERGVAVVEAIGLSGDKRVTEWLLPLVTDSQRTLAIRGASARAIGRSAAGQRKLLELVVDGKLPADLKFTAADILLVSRDEAIRTEAAKHLSLPESAGASPLPPVAELVKRRGNGANGHVVFTTKGTCSKCHQIGSEGKNVGPALTEIGSKLAKEAMYVAILDPSAGISHNYESYLVVTAAGTTAVGLLMSQTDDTVTIRTSEGIDQTFKMDDIDELIKQKTSIMPTGLQKLMSADELVDLVEYLQTLKKK